MKRLRRLLRLSRRHIMKWQKYQPGVACAAPVMNE
jgi:hypothetical protein